LATGTILVYEEDPREETKPEAAIYARVSSEDQKGDLGRQVSRLKDYASASGLRVQAVVEEIGSGLDDHRRKLTGLLGDPSVGTIRDNWRGMQGRGGDRCFLDVRQGLK